MSYKKTFLESDFSDIDYSTDSSPESGTIEYRGDDGGSTADDMGMDDMDYEEGGSLSADQIISSVLGDVLGFPADAIEEIKAEQPIMSAVEDKIAGMDASTLSDAIRDSLDPEGDYSDMDNGMSDSDGMDDDYDGMSDGDGMDDDIEPVNPEGEDYNIQNSTLVPNGRNESFLSKAISKLAESGSNRDVWINNKMDQLRTSAEKNNKPFNEARIKQQVIRQYQEEIRANPRAVQHDVKASQERTRSMDDA